VLAMEEVQPLELLLKSGQSFELLHEKPFVAQPEWSLRVLKERLFEVVRSPDPEHMVLVLQIEQTQQKLEGEENMLSSLGLLHGCTIFLYSDKVWAAQQTVNDASASAESRRRALQGLPGVGGYEQFLRDLCKAQDLSFLENKEVEEARKRLRERAALFGLQEAPGIDDQGDCQFDAAADQLRKFPQFSGETKESVRARAVSWIREHAEKFDLKNWIEMMPECDTLEQYLEKMSGPRYWGDEVTLLAIIEAYQVQVVMLSSVEGGNWRPTYYPRGKGPVDELPCLWLGHEHERHYWSLLAGRTILSSPVIMSGQLASQQPHSLGLNLSNKTRSWWLREEKALLSCSKEWKETFPGPSSSQMFRQLELLNANITKTSCVVLGQTYDTLPGVFHPNVFFGTAFLMQALCSWVVEVGSSFLEVGFGNGCVSLYVQQHLRTVQRVAGIDISEAACMCAKKSWAEQSSFLLTDDLQTFLQGKERACLLKDNVRNGMLYFPDDYFDSVFWNFPFGMPCEWECTF